MGKQGVDLPLSSAEARGGGDFPSSFATSNRGASEDGGEGA